MKYFSAVLAVVAMFLLSFSAIAGVPTTGGAFTNPAVNTIMADSGQVTDNNHEVQLFMACTVACVMVIEHRDATNAANVWSQYVPLPANSAQVFFITRWTVLNLNERIRVRLNAAITGAAQVSLIID